VPALDITGINQHSYARKRLWLEGSTVSEPEDLEAAVKLGLSYIGPYVLQVEVDPASPPLLGKDGPKKQRGA